MLNGTGKYTFAKILAGVFLGAGLWCGYNHLEDKQFLENNAKTKGFRREGKYTVVDYDYFRKMNSKDTNAGLFALMALGGLAGFAYSFKENTDVEAHFHDAKRKYGRYRGKQEKLKRRFSSLEDEITGGKIKIK